MHKLNSQPGTWKWGSLCLIFLAPFFFLTYGFANQYASALNNVPSIVFDWEHSIPLWPWTIIPYWSIDLFYGLSLLLCWNKFELKQHVLRLFTAQIISISCFLLFPLKFSFERPELHGFFGVWFDILMGFDKPFNQAPSLHIVLLVILWDFYRRHVNNSWKWIVDFWAFLIAISVLTTWQHHFIDLPTGLLVGALCLWMFPVQVKSPFKKEPRQQRTAKHIKLFIIYICAACIFLILSFLFQPWSLWLIYPAISLFAVAFAYILVRPHFFQKQENGRMTIASYLIFAPYFISAWINSRIWTKAHPEDSKIIKINNQLFYIGRIPDILNIQKYDVIFDCVAEMPVASTHQYQQYLSLDLIPLQAAQLEHAVYKLNQVLNCLHDNMHEQKILIFCALGYSRSSAVLCAWLLQSQHNYTVQDTINIIQKARPWVKLNPIQIQQLDLYHSRIKGLTA